MHACSDTFMDDYMEMSNRHWYYIPAALGHLSDSSLMLHRSSSLRYQWGPPQRTGPAPALVSQRSSVQFSFSVNHLQPTHYVSSSHLPGLGFWVKPTEAPIECASQAFYEGWSCHGSLSLVWFSNILLSFNKNRFTLRFSTWYCVLYQRTKSTLLTFVLWGSK